MDLIRFKSLGSGSSGNATVIQARTDARLTPPLVDCGLGIRELDKRLGQAGMLADQVDARMMSRAVTGHAASIGISGAASYILGELLAEAFGWRLAFASAGLTAAIAWLTVIVAVPGRPPPPRTATAALFRTRRKKPDWCRRWRPPGAASTR